MKYQRLMQDVREAIGDKPDSSPDVPCWKLQEAIQFLSEETGIAYETLCESMKCDSDCMEKYRTEKGDFKGGEGTAFKNCVKATEACCKGVKDPEAFCAYLGRRAGKI